ncbi:hypothetical protein [Actinoallomurus sp. CA-150999]|uniref:hypothetical protein n=1 Tax=Actinoallomurus sp. CA-150999 TaxID=3239887 RepID=UPI003D8EC2CD
MRHWKAFTAVIVWALALSLLGVMFDNRLTWGNWMPYAAPQRFDYCGGHFTRTAESMTVLTRVVSRAQALSDEGSVSGDRFRPMLHTGFRGRWTVYGSGTWDCAQEQGDVAHKLFVKVGGDRYIEFGDAH